MTFTKAMSFVGLAIYIFLWVLALNGASSFIPALVVPVVLAVLVAFGVWLNRFMGITPRAQHFTPRASELRPDGGGDCALAPEQTSESSPDPEPPAPAESS